MTDQELAMLLQQGDHKAFALLVDRWEVQLSRYIQRHCFSCEVEDLLQEVFLRVYKSIHDYQIDLSFSAWIYRITHNLMVSEIRKRSTQAPQLEFDENLIPSHLFRADKEINQKELNNQIANYSYNCLLNTVKSLFYALWKNWIILKSATFSKKMKTPWQPKFAVRGNILWNWLTVRI